jgi:hypothetical protein
MPYKDLTYGYYENRDITKIPLNGLQIRLLNPYAEVITYPELQNYDNIEDVFNGKQKIIILYLLQNEHSGHWTTLFKNSDGMNFFDSYGVMPDYQFELLNPQKRAKLNQEQDYLNNHLLKDYKVIYNNITYQSPDKGIATCGCFVSHRLANSHLNDIQYCNIFVESGQKPDDVVAEWCFSKLDKM